MVSGINYLLRIQGLSLSRKGEILLFRNRVVMPPALTRENLDILHSGHQGVTAMVAIASQTIFWPGMNESIASCRAACRSCDREAHHRPQHPHGPYRSLAFHSK